MQWFVIGHDCGHRSFSKNKLVEDIVGTLMFMPLIYPFEPWRIKHNQHHAHTNKRVKLAPQLVAPAACSLRRTAPNTQSLQSWDGVLAIHPCTSLHIHGLLHLTGPVQAGRGHSLASSAARDNGPVEPGGALSVQDLLGQPVEAVGLYRPLVDLAL